MSTVTLPDGTQIITTVTPNGQTVQVIPGPGTPDANLQTLLTKAANAIVTNQTYLAIATPTNAQVVAQVNALTLQVNALIRVVANQLSSTSGT